MSKTFKTGFAAMAALATLAVAAPTAVSAQARSNGITSCDAPGGRQQVGALLGALAGGYAGSRVSSNERTLGAVIGAGAGAAAGSYVGCNQQRARLANQEAQASRGALRSTSTLNIRSGPSTRYRTTGQLQAGQPFTAIGSSGEWVQIAGGGWVNARYVVPN